ncbi:SapC family protein [Glaciecola sp. 1036]|uniref:SapC family protein n=1 Tax=Alteromonadaceae TaxID=72275 RepID=UPI003CFC735B
MAINYIPLDKAKHGALKIIPKTDFSFAKETHLAAATIREYAQLSNTMPIVLIQDPTTNNIHSVAMLGLEQGKNLFWSEDRWQGANIPLNIQRYPFDIRPDGDKLGVFIDESSELFGDEGEPLFTESGEPSELLKNRQQFLADLANSEVQNQRFIKQLQDNDLLEELQIRIRYVSGQTRNVTGILSVNEKKLLEMEDDKVLAMHKAGFLGACYSLMLSLGQLNRLVELSNKTENPIQAIQVVTAAQAAREQELAQSQAAAPQA